MCPHTRIALFSVPSHSDTINDSVWWVHPGPIQDQQRTVTQYQENQSHRIRFPWDFPSAPIGYPEAKHLVLVGFKPTLWQNFPHNSFTHKEYWKLAQPSRAVRISVITWKHVIHFPSTLYSDPVCQRLWPRSIHSHNLQGESEAKVSSGHTLRNTVLCPETALICIMPSFPMCQRASYHLAVNGSKTIKQTGWSRSSMCCRKWVNPR